MHEIFDKDDLLNEAYEDSAAIEYALADAPIDISEEFDESGEIPEKPTAKLPWEVNSFMPGEQPATRPKDETNIMIGNGTEIKDDIYNKAMKSLKDSFKEATEIIDILADCNVVKSDKKII